jgi:hypothetical protein
MKEWLITLEHPPFFTFKYCKCDDGSYIGEKISTSRYFLDERFTFASNSELVADVCSQVRGYYRVKEMPQKYGQFWRERDLPLSASATGQIRRHIGRIPTKTGKR